MTESSYHIEPFVVRFRMVVGYARVSTEQQDTEGQLPDLKKAGCKRIYQETMSGGTMERPELEKCLDRLEKGDTLVVWRLDRLGRSIRDLLQIVDRLDKTGINFISLASVPQRNEKRAFLRLCSYRTSP